LQFELEHEVHPLPSTYSNANEAPATPVTRVPPATTAGLAARAASPTRSRGRKFVSYYRPYLGLFIADMACAPVVAAITLLLPICARYVTKNVLEAAAPHALDQIYLVGGLMLALVGVQTLCTIFIDFQGHMMGAKMEGDMRGELFEHFQKLSFSFY